jgi:hypothetical protein
MKDEGLITPEGKGRGARWRRLEELGSTTASAGQKGG